MSSRFVSQLNNTLTSLEAQAVTAAQIKALLVWYTQSEDKANALEALLEEANSSANADSPMPIHNSITQSLNWEADECYKALNNLTPCDMARFSLIQEFGPSFKSKPFFYSLVQRIASRIA